MASCVQGRVRSGSLLVGFFTLSCWLSAQAVAADAPLTLVQAQTMAMTRSRQLAALDFSAQSSQEMAVAAGQLPDPVLKMGIDNLPANGPDRFSLSSDFMTMRRVGIMQEITNADKRSARAQIYQSTADKTRAEKLVTTAAIDRDTALAWLDRYYAEKMAATIQEQVNQNRLEIQAAESGYRAGRSNQAEIFAARSALALMEDKASEIQQQLRSAKTTLARWIGSAAAFTLDELPVMDSVRLDPAMLESQLEHHPEISVLNRQINLAQADEKLAQANKTADWSVGLTYQQRGSAYTDMVSVEVSIPIQWDQKNRQNRELYAKQMVVEQATAERDDMLRQHVSQTRVMFDEWHNDRDRAERFTQELLPLAHQRVQAMLASYRGGKANLSALLAARRDEIEMQLQSWQIQNQTARLWAQLNFLMPAQTQSSMNTEHP